MKNTIILMIFSIFCSRFLNAQIKSMSDSVETIYIKNDILKIGYSKDTCDIDDVVCNVLNEANRKAYIQLKEPNVGFVKLFSPLLFKEIKSYDFADHFDLYFEIDTLNYNIYSFYSLDGVYSIFGGISKDKNRRNSPSYSNFVYQERIYDVFMNSSYRNNGALIFQMSFENSMFVVNNKIYVIEGNHVVDGKTFFKKFTLYQINSLFVGMRQDLPANLSKFKK